MAPFIMLPTYGPWYMVVLKSTYAYFRVILLRERISYQKTVLSIEGNSFIRSNFVQR